MLHMCFKFCYISLPLTAKHQSEMTKFKVFWEHERMTANFSFSFLNFSVTPTNLVTGWFAISEEVKRVKVMLKSSTNKIILYFQVMFSSMSPSSLIKFTNHLTQDLNKAHWCFLVRQMGRTPRLAILETAATSSTWYPGISFIQMARHHKSSLYGQGIAGFHEFIQKKIPHNLAVLSSSFMLWSDNVNWNSCILNLHSILANYTVLKKWTTHLRVYLLRSRCTFKEFYIKWKADIWPVQLV